MEAWFCYAEADFSKHGVIDTRAQFLAVVKALPREFKQLRQLVQTVLVSFQNNALDELAASDDRILEITKSSTAEVFSVKKASNDSE
ncbi:unnamed protein product [Schistosoma margrebowiei]|uniref:Uncharacterized protein n=1 Tax=Schistosoma margrebowiei TaxID=48269 RepID=A0A183NAN6_9TREM|nr:unnamed protein product [Schistosoma margrebowiei]